MKMTWHFAISAVLASTVFGPRLWPLSARRHSLAACVDLIQENEMRPLNPTVNFSPVYFIIKWFKTGPDTCLNFLHVQTYFELVWFCISRVFKGHEMSIFESWYVVFIFMDLQSFLRSIYELSRSFWALFKYSSLLLVILFRANTVCF